MKKHICFLIAAAMAMLFSFAACSGDDVNVTGVTLNKATASIYAGASENLTETVLPENAANKKVSWSTSDARVAIVSDGSVSGVAPGSANITVTTEDGNFSATCVVAVSIPPPTGVSLNKAATTILAGMDERLTATVTPPEADQRVIWTSSNHAVASIAKDGDGTVIAMAGPGTANITATSSDGKITSPPCAVTVTPNIIVATDLIVVPSSLTLMAPIPAAPDRDTTVRLSAVIAPPNAPPSSIAWSVSDPAKASVSSGFVRALASGNVDIIAASGELMGICSLTVTDPVRVAGITVAPAATTIAVGNTRQMSATVTPATATYPNHSWSSNDTNIATVSDTGLVTALRPGAAIITATTLDGNHSSSGAITVAPAAVTGVSIIPALAECLLNETVRLRASVRPSYAENKNVTWSSLNPAIATVDASGLVTGRQPGKATITAVTQQGGFSAACTVTVVTELSPVNIYYSGEHDNNDPNPIWGKNDNLYYLDPRRYDWGQGQGIAVDDYGDVYIAGWNDNISGARHQAVVWKNGLSGYQALHNPFNDGFSGYSEATSIFVDGATQYVAGWIGASPNLQCPCIWVNGQVKELPRMSPDSRHGRCFSVTVSDDIVYVAGQDSDDQGGAWRAAVWKDDGIDAQLTRLHPDGKLASYAVSVSVSNNNVYAAGYYWNGTSIDDPIRAALWKNGVMQEITHFPGAKSETVTSVFADGADVYMVGTITFWDENNGRDYYAPAIWENGAGRLLLDNPNLNAYAYSVCVNRGIAYVGGTINVYDADRNIVSGYLTIWKNGEPASVLPPANSLRNYYWRPMSIFVSIY